MNNKNAEKRSVGERDPIEMFPGVRRSTLCYDDQLMLCHFTMEKGATIPLHNHLAVQNGFILAGRVRFFKEDGSSFDVGPGDGYLFSSNEKHGSEAFEQSALIESFTPIRPEYVD